MDKDKGYLRGAGRTVLAMLVAAALAAAFPTAAKAQDGALSLRLDKASGFTVTPKNGAGPWRMFCVFAIRAEDLKTVMGKPWYGFPRLEPAATADFKNLGALVQKGLATEVNRYSTVEEQLSPKPITWWHQHYVLVGFFIKCDSYWWHRWPNEDPHIYLERLTTASLDTSPESLWLRCQIKIRVLGVLRYKALDASHKLFVEQGTNAGKPVLDAAESSSNDQASVNGRLIIYPCWWY